MSDAVRVMRGGDTPVGPQVGTADAGGDDAHDGVASGGKNGIGDLFDADVPFAVDDGSKHG
ncbi:hypothetical protein GCM10017584_28740 [Leifsonia poae]|uniref:Uncharacterized protein n=1 Tax=Leifsonia poae TaxID=110933 RepID=A0A9W6HB75_9MICO|nr:hypothetical protein GCM10017584_28740 [Leifsonia poae]